MIVGTFGSATVSKKVKKTKSESKHSVTGTRFKCSRCIVATDSEDVITSHIISDNSCNATYYTDAELRKCCSGVSTTLACIDCPF